jgi:hypothetical protein
LLTRDRVAHTPPGRLVEPHLVRACCVGEPAGGRQRLARSGPRSAGHDAPGADADADLRLGQLDELRGGPNRTQGVVLVHRR